MQFARLFAVAATAIATANAAVQFTNSVFNNVTAGQSFTLTWSGATGPVDILLKNGPSTALVTVSTVASGQTGTSFTYSVPANLPADTYAFSITDGSTTNYSPQFQPLSATASPTSGASSTASGSSSASSGSSSASSVSSSISSRISSLSSSLISSITANSTSSTASATGSSNSTTSGASSTGSSATKTGSSTASKTSATATSTGSTVPNTNGASEFASPFALVFLTVAAIISLN